MQITNSIISLNCSRKKQGSVHADSKYSADDSHELHAAAAEGCSVKN